MLRPKVRRGGYRGKMLKTNKIILVLIILLLAQYSFGFCENLSTQASKYPPDKVCAIAKAKHIPLVMVFYAAWCAECSQYLPVINELENVYGDKIIFLKVNVEDTQNEQFTLKHKNNKIVPQTIIYDKNFETVSDFTGKKDKSEMESYLKKL